ncbi:MAG: hypothetical protein ABIT47_02640 [Candidatus Paceibacterota bacterium]
MKPTLFIDFDGTLCHDRFWRSLEPELQDKVQNHLFISNREIVSQWMKGSFTSEEINRKLSEEIGIDFEDLWEIFVNDCKTMTIESGTLEQLRELKSLYRIVLVTDNMDSFDRFTVPALGLNNHFDKIVNSWMVKAFKNDNKGESFRKTILDGGSNIDESILIDNSTQSCEIFKELGGDSYLVTPEKSLSFWLEQLLGSKFTS